VSQYVAPARRALSVLHVAEPGAGPVTVCGLLMRIDELWREVERRPGERVCLRCAGEVAETVVAVQGTLGE